MRPIVLFFCAPVSVSVEIAPPVGALLNECVRDCQTAAWLMRWMLRASDEETLGQRSHVDNDRIALSFVS